MDPRSGYPQLLGYQLANALTTANDAQKLKQAVSRCLAIYKSAKNENQRVQLCNICEEFKIVVKVAELSLQVHEAENASTCRLNALEDLCWQEKQIQAIFWRPVIQIVLPVLARLRIDSSTLHSLTQQLCTAEMFFEREEFTKVFRIIGERVYLNATAVAEI